MQKMLERAQGNHELVERELKKYPDFQLYLLTRSRKDRARMERLLMDIPEFRLWRTLTKSTKLPHRPSAALPTAPEAARAHGGFKM
jgi:hypothetical protein